MDPPPAEGPAWENYNGRANRVAVAVFAVSLSVYLSSGFFPSHADAEVNGRLAESLVRARRLSMGVREIPALLNWTVKGSGATCRVRLDQVDDSILSLVGEGALTADPTYVVQPTDSPGVFGSSFFPGPAVVAAPAFALMRGLASDWLAEPVGFWWTSKVVASVCAAGSAALMYLLVRRRAALAPALTLTIAYSFGTGVWSTSSQYLLSHSPNALFLTAALLFLDDKERKFWTAVLAGAFLGAATCCRPTSALVALMSVLVLVVIQPRRSLGLVAGGLPFAIALGVYHWMLFGAPWAFGELAQAGIARETTGQEGMWPTSPLEGLTGLLFSPGRGLFVFSPFFAFAIPGAIQSFRRADGRIYTIPALSAAAIWLLHAFYFDWWGGWTYGCRHLVDTGALLTPLIALSIGHWWGRKGWRRLFAVLVVWSIALQAIGAWIDDLESWNARPLWRLTTTGLDGKKVVATTTDPRMLTLTRLDPSIEIETVLMNIDELRWRHRLWSMSDWQPWQDLMNWRVLRAKRREIDAANLLSNRQKMIEARKTVARGLREVGLDERAERVEQAQGEAPP